MSQPEHGTAEKDARLARLQAAIAVGDWKALRELRHAAPMGEPDAEWREAFLMSHLFAGFPRAVEAALVLQRAGGLGEPSAQECSSQPTGPEAGRPLFETIYSGQTETVLGMLREGHPAFEEWILGHAYGRVLSRPGLSAARRELLACAALTALGQDRQLGSHVRGALRCGAEFVQIEAMLEAIVELVEPAQFERCREVVRHFASR